MSLLWPGRKHTLISRLALLLLRALGWTPVLSAPPPKFVGAIAPHTSNADFWPGLLYALGTRLPYHFVAKHQLFTFPLGIFMRAVGGLPVNRRRAGGNFVDAVVAIIEREKELVLVVAPEGTRARAEYWKTGFYYMALEARVPIGVVVLDWGHKRVGMIGYIQPSGDLEADFALMREMFADVRGHTPANETPVRPRPPEAGGPSKD